MTNRSIWASVEFNCISRDFNHAGYLVFHKETAQVGAPVDEQAYQELQKVFHGAMERSFHKQETDHGAG